MFAFQTNERMNEWMCIRNDDTCQLQKWFEEAEPNAFQTEQHDNWHPEPEIQK